MNDKFKEQFPDYPIIPPAKKRNFTGALILIGSLIGVGGTATLMIYELTRFTVPTPTIAGYNSLSMGTLANAAKMHADQGQHQEAIKLFNDYFKLGGKDAEVMASYASSLEALGHHQLAVKWSRQAVAQDPQSKAARFIQQSLENKR